MIIITLLYHNRYHKKE